MRIFLDANVLFSAAALDGAVRELLDLLLERGHECWVDGLVVTEARRNLALKTQGGVGALECLLERVRMTRLQPAVALPEGIELAEKDRPVLNAAIGLGCDALVTGDRTHFGGLYGRTVLGVTIHSPRSLAEAVLA